MLKRNNPCRGSISTTNVCPLIPQMDISFAFPFSIFNFSGRRRNVNSTHGWNVDKNEKRRYILEYGRFVHRAKKNFYRNLQHNKKYQHIIHLILIFNTNNFQNEIHYLNSAFSFHICDMCSCKWNKCRPHNAKLPCQFILRLIWTFCYEIFNFCLYYVFKLIENFCNDSYSDVLLFIASGWSSMMSIYVNTKCFICFHLLNTLFIFKMEILI